LLKKSVVEDPHSNWRVNEINFVEKGVCEPGAVTFSGGWFAQGHTVRFEYLHPRRINKLILPPESTIPFETLSESQIPT
jgi:hypothetical protein